MSLELSEGKVKVNFDLGSGVGSATSANRHNDGRWKSLTMSRNKKQGSHDNISRVFITLRQLDQHYWNEIERNERFHFVEIVCFQSYGDCGGHWQRCWGENNGQLTGFSRWSQPKGEPKNLFRGAAIHHKLQVQLVRFYHTDTEGQSYFEPSYFHE